MDEARARKRKRMSYRNTGSTGIGRKGLIMEKLKPGDQWWTAEEMDVLCRVLDENDRRIASLEAQLQDAYKAGILAGIAKTKHEFSKSDGHSLG